MPAAVPVAGVVARTAAFGAASRPRAPMVVLRARGGSANEEADAAADAMADEMADAVADEMMTGEGGGGRGRNRRSGQRTRCGT